MIHTTLQLSLTDDQREIRQARRFEPHTELLQPIEPDPYGTLSDKQNALRSRKRRREAFYYWAQELASAMIDCIEDAEGWHGEERQEKTLAAQKKENA